MSDVGGPDEETELTAGELALGLLDGSELDAARRRTMSDSAFARSVENWEARLAGLALDVSEAVPSPHVWRAVQRQIGGGRAAELHLQRALTFWRAATAAAAVVAAALALDLVVQRPAPPPALTAPVQPKPILAARLTSPKGAVVFIAVLDPARHELVLAPATVQAKAGRSPELWLMPTGGKPIALGVGTFDRVIRLNPASGLVGSAQAKLGVSLEPEGGSPTGQPTGPVLGTGELAPL